MFAMAHRRKCALWMKVSRLQSPYRHTTYGGRSRGILCRRQQNKSNLFFFLQIPHISEKEVRKRSIDTFRKSEGDVLGNRETSALRSVLFPIFVYTKWDFLDFSCLLCWRPRCPRCPEHLHEKHPWSELHGRCGSLSGGTARQFSNMCSFSLEEIVILAN